MSGLGNRLAYFMVGLIGRTSLGLCYAVTFTEAAMAPFIPAIVARVGVLLPVVRSLAAATGSRVADGTQAVMGRFLILSLFQVRGLGELGRELVFVARPPI